MKPTIELELVEFKVPTHVQVKLPPAPRQQGFREPLEIPLSEIELDTLKTMCENFTASVIAAHESNRISKIR